MSDKQAPDDLDPKSFTIVSAAWANEGRTAMTVVTAEAGPISINAADQPGLWAKALAGAVAAYEPPPPPPEGYRP